ncbi:MAG: endonuclease III [Nanoarchaeota archaeon]
MDRSKTIQQVVKKLRHNYGTTMLAGISKDPFQVLIATALSARSRDEVTGGVARNLFKAYPTAKKLAAAREGDVKKIIKRIGFYNTKAKRVIAIAKEVVDGVPDTMEELVQLPGVGRKTAGCVLVYAFGKDAIPVDTHVHRISNRLGLVSTKDPLKTERALMKITPQKDWRFVNDLLVHHGKNVCKPIIPRCGECPLTSLCAFYRKVNK